MARPARSPPSPRSSISTGPSCSGGLLRVVYLFSASMPGVVRNLTFRQSSSPDFEIEFVVPHAYRDFAGERLEGRLQQLAKLTNRRLTFRFE